LHLVHAARLRDNARRFQAAPDGQARECEIFYSYKTNPVPGVLRELHRAGLGAEVISHYELWLARRLGVPAERIVYNGPAKSRESVREAIASGIALLNVNHREEIAVVAGLAAELGGKPRIGIRVTVAEGWSGQFGVPVAGGHALAAYGEAVRSPSLEVVGLHAHRGGMIRSAEELISFVDAVLAFTDQLEERLGIVEHTHYIIGSVVGPHPFPMIVRDFQSVIGRECGEQCVNSFGALPDAIVACVGGGSNAAGIFAPFIDDAIVKLIGVEAGGRSNEPGEHAAPLSLGSPGVLHGSYSYVLQDKFGQTADVHSCSAGLDYPGVGPEHSHWKDSGRVKYISVTDAEALHAFELLAQTEGIIPALETAHAVAAAVEVARSMPEGQRIVINISGRGDKDVQEVMRLMGEWPT
jgi:tryptophan synthase beta subunit